MFSEETIQNVWNKASVVDGFDSAAIRKDSCGAWIIRNHYGQRDSDYGWEIDHVFPEALGGGDDIINLRAMQWENNMAKGDDYPSYISAVQAEGNKNVHKKVQYTVNDELQSRLASRYPKR